MNKTVKFLSALALGICATLNLSAAQGTKAVEELAKRILPTLSADIRFKTVESGEESFTYYTSEGKLFIEGDSNNSLAMGLGDYLRNCCNITVTWYERDKVIEPEVLPSVTTKVTRKALVKDRFFLNYCTYGYSLNWWKWKEWERLIDWFALNGVNMVLANTGQEAVWQKVWMQFGLTAEQTRSHFTGPSYLAWHRMTNVDGWDGPLPQNWIDAQAELQKKIIERETSLGISPILTSFNGHVPAVFAKMHPEANIRQLNAWGRFTKEYNCWYLNPNDPLFAEIQRVFLKTQKEMFGQDTHIYGVDPFNEVDPPMWDAQYLESAAKKTYESIAESDPDAVWLQMAWLFWHKKKNWTNDLVKAYLSPVPKGKLLMLDYYCEKVEIYRNTESFFGQDFIWSYLGNFGGNLMITGDIADISSKITRCYKEGGNNFKGIGCTLEGLDVNPYMYEYVLDRAWEQRQDDAQWFRTLADRRLGFADEHYRKAWETMRTDILKDVAGNRSSRLPGRPSLREKTNWNSTTIAYDNKDLLKVWEELCRVRPSQSASFRFDCVNIPRQCMENHFSSLATLFIKAVKNNDYYGARKISGEMKELLSDLDALLAADSYFLLGKWVTDARSWGADEAQKDYFEHDSRSILTVWGMKGVHLNDYANRALNGLVRTYYAPRWEKFLDELLDSMKNGKPWDGRKFEDWSKDFEWNWVDSEQEFRSEPCGNAYGTCRKLFRKYSRKIGL